jgi:3',5'-cyclic AMP phosphodiesterase CpdA
VRLETAALLLASVTLSCGASQCESARATETRPSPALDAGRDLDAGARRTVKGGTDVTFIVVSDTHFGFGDIEKTNAALVPKLNAMAGKAYPHDLGGTIAPPRGLLVTGDLTEWGKVEEWEPFVATYGLRGTEAALRMPVFEVIGNHDKVHGPWVEQQVSARHGGRFYAWDWDDVHFVALGEAPDDEGLAFLERDLSRVDGRVPLVLYFHLALLGPWSTGHWFGDGDYKGRLARILKGHLVAGNFHGHHHATGHYQWAGIDVWKPGAVKDGAHTFAVVHVTDARMTVASYDYDRDAWAGTFAKALR